MKIQDIYKAKSLIEAQKAALEYERQAQIKECEFLFSSCYEVLHELENSLTIEIKIESRGFSFRPRHGDRIEYYIGNDGVAVVFRRAVRGYGGTYREYGTKEEFFDAICKELANYLK